MLTMLGLNSPVRGSSMSNSSISSGQELLLQQPTTLAPTSMTGTMTPLTGGDDKTGRRLRRKPSRADVVARELFEERKWGERSF